MIVQNADYRIAMQNIYAGNISIGARACAGNVIKVTTLKIVVKMITRGEV